MKGFWLLCFASIGILLFASRSQAQDTTVDLRVRVMMTSSGLLGDSLFADEYPNDIQFRSAARFVNRIMAYGGAFKVWIGPRGWTGSSACGADGNVWVDLNPQNGTDSTGPYIHYWEIPACAGCIFSAAAPYFPDAMRGWNLDFNRDGKIPIKVPHGLKITSVSPTLITYTLPDSNGLKVEGVAYYNSGGEDSDASFSSAEFAMPAKDSVLTSFLLKTFIQREGLK
ncbi:MAG TPA: DUF4850 domain-containing protein [Candidatus Acidoferrales bacterium]|nr:DUF4850 domain-containing protein [Candidatus Acidoferrales bacterium]